MMRHHLILRVIVKLLVSTIITSTTEPSRPITPNTGSTGEFWPLRLAWASQ